MSSSIENLGVQQDIISVQYTVQDAKFIQYVSEKKDILAASNAGVPLEESEYQIDLAIKFMKFYMEGNENDGLLDRPEAKHEFHINTHKTPFEILLDLHSAMRSTCVGFKLYFYGNNPSQNAFISKLLEFPSFELLDEKVKFTGPELPVSFCTMVVHESADLESATDVLAKAWTWTTIPWAIRSVLVQESVQEKFTELLQAKLKPFKDNVHFEKELRSSVSEALKTGLTLIQNPDDKNDVKPTVVVGSNVDFLLQKGSSIPSPVVILNVFRTAKEAIALANKEDGGSISLWTEEISLAFEVAYAFSSLTVWINSHALFNPQFPYNFRKHEYCYGSEYAIYEKKIKKFFVKTSESETNDVAINKAAIVKLGICPPKVAKQSLSYVRNEKKVHYEMESSAFPIENYNKDHKMGIVEDFWSKYTTIDEADIDVLFDTVYNERKTVVIPYGVSFGN